MTPEERDAFLGEERTCRVGTVGADGPHVPPLWFVWHGEAIWLTSIVKSQRWADVQRGPYAEARGSSVRASGSLLKARSEAARPILFPTRRFRRIASDAYREPCVHDPTTLLNWATKNSQGLRP